MKPVIVLFGGNQDEFVKKSKHFCSVFDVKPSFDDGERYSLSDYDLLTWQLPYYYGCLNAAFQTKNTDLIVLHNLPPVVCEKIREFFECEIYSVGIANNWLDYDCVVSEDFSNLEKILKIISK